MITPCSAPRSWVGPLLLVAAILCSANPAHASAGFADGGTDHDKAPLRVFVSIAPQKCFVERVAGQRAEVTVLLPSGQSPATYEPTPKQMVRLASAQVYFRIGVPFEKSVVDKIGATLEHLNIVDMRAGIDLRTMAEACEHGHHGDEAEGHDHQPGEVDPHVWLNPRLVKTLARNTCDEFCRLDPSNREAYEGNLRSFEGDLDRVDRRIAAILAPLRGCEFYVFHPAFGYFADAYGLEQVAVEAGGREPTAKRLGALITRAKRAGVKLIFVQPQFSSRSAEAVARQIGGAVVSMDPLAENYIDNLLDMAAKVERALTGGGAATDDGS